ncbi:PhzF family phenazine biosynthesis protein [Polymorphospora rubra]|uniref:PhzF family phenazine biosynthesis protein n=1 Tax=Polymorphospora rubra TaxID=338584 RepID=UPI00340963B5
MTNSPPDRIPFVFVDVFASTPLTGNPVAVVPDADDLTEPTMRAIAREFNQSETTFILRPTLAGATWRLRSFTPIGEEVLGAGHNALGAWLWLAGAGRLPADRPSFTQQIGDALLPVDVTGPPRATLVTMRQSTPEFGATVSDAADRAELAAALGLTGADLDTATVPQVVSTGAGHLLVPVTGRDAVDRARPDGPRLAAAVARAGGEGCYVYSRDPVDPTDAVAYARFFNPGMGISEDPATGTAAGPLLARLVADGAVTEGTAVIEQGYRLGRPSRIRVGVTGDRVEISGTGLVVAEGVLRTAPPSGAAE